MGKHTRGQLKQRPREAAGQPCEVEGCEVTECSNWYAQGRCCSKKECKLAMGVPGVTGAADGIRKPRKPKPLAEVTNTPAQVKGSKMSKKAALAWQEAGRKREEAHALGEARRRQQSRFGAWAMLMEKRMQFYEDVLAAMLDVDVEDEAALDEMRDNLEEKYELVWPEQPAWLLEP